MSDEPIRKPTPKWLEKYGNMPERGRRSREHEKRIGESLGGRKVPRSGGSLWSSDDHTTDDGDIATPNFWIEHKGTTTSTMSIKKAYCDKVREGARKNAKDPAVCFTFETPNGRKKEDWVAVPLEVFKRLCRAAGIQLDD
jgi:hypothetical protein